MLKYHLVLICLFSSGFFIYLPFDYMAYDLNIDYLCYYDTSSNKYVKSCEKGQYCQKFKSDIGICQNITEDLISKLGEDCDSKFQCDKDLICDSNKCTFNKVNNKPYKVVDSENNGIYYYYCPSEEIPIVESSSTFENPFSNLNYICQIPINNQKGKCFNSESESIIFPEYSKVCGKIELDKPSTENQKQYTRKNVNTSDIGEIDEYEIVEDERACKSGYALYFYGNKELNKPEDETSYSNMFKRCVNFIESKKLGDGCRIKYSLGDEKEYIYNSNMLDSDGLKGDKLFTECEFLETKLQFFKDYLKEMTDEKKEECKKYKFYNEPFTCGKDEIRKIWYFYNHPEEYILYKNEEDIINFLLQQAYPFYGNNKNSSESDSSDSTQSSTFLNIKYFISLLILLSF